MKVQLIRSKGRWLCRIQQGDADVTEMADTPKAAFRKCYDALRLWWWQERVQASYP